MKNAQSGLLGKEGTLEISVLNQLSAFEKLLNGSANLYFGEIDPNKMIRAYLEDDLDYLDTLYKSYCAMSAYHFDTSKQHAGRDEFLDAMNELGEAKSLRLAAMENYCGNIDLTEQHKERQKNYANQSRIDSLQELIIKIVAKKPDINEKALLIEIEKKRGCGVINDVDDDVIYFNHKGEEKDAPISGLKDRLSRAKKKKIIRAAG